MSKVKTEKPFDTELTGKFFNAVGPFALAGFMIGAGGTLLASTGGIGALALGAYSLRPAFDMAIFGSLSMIGASIGTMIGGTGVALAADTIKNALDGPN